ncbi:hypothetical protein JK358_25920 [Nocardia sp. 2]|uniref:Uncharacterized protein n=1 Tax=Nocardia acididurans TaxID=2802282 RepID=A0ABS1MB97_9NOCA|nr:hypothetical protein [Nocardia acididurans]MBL1077846.1 hypothetical protein [Nocardia acididurans]
MRTRFRAGVLVGALLLAPLGAAATASAVPLAPAAEPEPVATVCVQQWPDSLICLLTSFSADSSSAEKK